MGKYDKLFHAVNPEKFRSGGPDDLKKFPDVYHFDYRDNVAAPHFIEGSFARKAGKVSHIGGISEFPQPAIYYSSLYRSDHRRQFPNSHPIIETTSLISIDPDHPDTLGGTFWHWMGEGDDAEAHIINKPTTLLVPQDTVHLPQYCEELHAPVMTVVVLDSPLFQFMPSRRILPPGFENADDAGWAPPKSNAGRGKYDYCYSAVDVNSLPVYPAHQGKIKRVMYFDRNINVAACHCMDMYLIYGAGAGFGLGDARMVPDWANGRSDEFSSYEPLKPHVHACSQTYSFIGTDQQHLDDLGGTVEFWMGEGKDAEKHTITGAATVLIPKDIVHLPMYVKEVHRPFVLAIILDSPVWAGCWSLEFPGGFKA